MDRVIENREAKKMMGWVKIDRLSENPKVQRKSTGSVKTDRLRKRWFWRKSIGSMKIHRHRKNRNVL